MRRSSNGNDQINFHLFLGTRERDREQRESDNGVIHLIVFDQFRSFCTNAKRKRIDSNGMCVCVCAVRTSSFFFVLQHFLLFCICICFLMTMMVNMVHSMVKGKMPLSLQLRFAIIFVNARKAHTRLHTLTQTVRNHRAIDVVAFHALARARTPSCSFRQICLCVCVYCIHNVDAAVRLDV